MPCTRAAFVWSHDRASRQPGLTLFAAMLFYANCKSPACFRCMLLFRCFVPVVFHLRFVFTGAFTSKLRGPLTQTVCILPLVLSPWFLTTHAPPSCDKADKGRM